MEKTTQTSAGFVEASDMIRKCKESVCGGSRSIAPFTRDISTIWSCGQVHAPAVLPAVQIDCLGFFDITSGKVKVYVTNFMFV